MALYKFIAKKNPQETLEDIVEADSKAEALEKLSRQGLFPLRIEEYRPQEVEERSYRGRIRSREITVFTRQLSILLRSGVPILSALNTLKEQTSNLHLKKIIFHIYQEIKNGNALSQVLEKHSRFFPPLYIAMVKAGESSGTMPEVLFRIANYRRSQEELLSHIRAALAYPVLMTIVGLGTIVFMLTFVMPRLWKIFESLGQELPLPTKILIDISTFIRKDWVWIIIVLLVFILVFKKYAHTAQGRLFFSGFKLRLPLWGKLMLKAELVRFCRTLELLLKSGIPILRAIEVSIPVLQNELIRMDIKDGVKVLKEGGSLGRSLKKSKILPYFMTNLLIVGEESGRLDESLREISFSYQMDIEESLKIMSSLLEPVLILVMGLLVGFIVMAMLLPLFQITATIR